MKRDATTPLILWICAAICVHFLFGGGAEEVATIHDDHVYLHRMATAVRDRVRQEEQVFDVSLFDAKKTDTHAEPPPPPPKPKPKPPEVKKPPPPAKIAKLEKKPPEQKKDEKKAIVVAKDDKAKPLPPPPPALDHRIAVKQHAQENQADNPNAHFIADQANHVDQETAATLTSHDRDEANPTPGGNHSGPQGETGDSERTKIADSEEHAGDKNRAPGEKGREFEEQKDPMLQTPPAAVAVQGPKTQSMPTSGGDGRTATSTPPAPAPQLVPGAAGQTSPDVTSGSDGTWTFNPIRPNAGAGTAQDQGPGSATERPANAVPPTSVAWLGLGGHPGPGQVNLNLNQMGVIAAVGADQLRKEREADGERRRSEHRGSWIASSFERWRSAIENYVSSVKPGNQTALNTAQVPFASYLNAMHNRIHPIFADGFLESLDNLPATHPMNDQHLITRLEIVLTKEGHVQKMGVVRTSGITAFDIAALDAVQRASPFGPAPTAIISPDGNVYLHWEFHRDEVYACSTMNARPFLLNIPAKGSDPPDPTLPPGSKPPPSQERGVPSGTESREGMLLPASPAHVATL
ncbi:MAG: energy transducer TonB [Polyangiaceae bacterium]|jgi:TonB family protein